VMQKLKVLSNDGFGAVLWLVNSACHYAVTRNLSSRSLKTFMVDFPPGSVIRVKRDSRDTVQVPITPRGAPRRAAVIAPLPSLAAYLL
jgi:hypothetical protein